MHNSDRPNSKEITGIRKLSHNSQISNGMNDEQDIKATEIPIEGLCFVKEKQKQKTLHYVVPHDTRNPQMYGKIKQSKYLKSYLEEKK